MSDSDIAVERRNKLRKQGYVQMPRVLLYGYDGLSMETKMLYLVMDDIAGQRDSSRYSIEYMALIMHRTDRHIITHLQKLKAAKLLTIQKVPGQRSIYWIEEPNPDDSFYVHIQEQKQAYWGHRKVDGTVHHPVENLDGGMNGCSPPPCTAVHPTPERSFTSIKGNVVEGNVNEVGGSASQTPPATPSGTTETIQDATPQTPSAAFSGGLGKAASVVGEETRRKGLAVKHIQMADLWKTWTGTYRREYPKSGANWPEKPPAGVTTFNLETLLNEFGYEDAKMLLEMSVMDWEGIRESQAWCCKDVVPSFPQMFKARQELICSVYSRRGVMDNSGVSSWAARVQQNTAVPS